MSLDSATRKALSAAANRLPVRAAIAAGDVSDAVALHVATTFDPDGLTKVRIHTDDRDECAATAAQLARRVGCELVQVVGRVATLYRPPPPPPASAQSTASG